MKISISIFTDRTLVGQLQVGQKSYPVCADSHSGFVVPTGKYRLILALAVQSDNPLRAELGPKVLLFEGAVTKKLIALHAGYTDARGSFLPTDGSLRVGYEDVCKIAGKAKKSTTPVMLTITERVVDSSTKLLGMRTSDAYMPPSTLRGALVKQGAASDLWAGFAKQYMALGCTLCHQW